jgi:two-component system CheB/CheR fusion protein
MKKKSKNARMDNNKESVGSLGSKASETPDDVGQDHRSFPIIAMVASAGGLEVFKQFFRHVQPDSGMAFVLVSHLDPGHTSMLAEILQRITAQGKEED